MASPVDPETGLWLGTASQPFPVGPADGHALLAQLQDSPANRVALIDGPRRWSGPELATEADAVAASLLDRFGSGAHIAWSMPNCAELVIAFLASMRAELVWIGLGPHLREAERSALAAQAEAQLTVTSPEFVTNATGQQHPSRWGPSRPDRLAALAATSGTTGTPKLVAHRERSLLWPAAASLATEPVRGVDVTFTPHSLASLNLMLLGPLCALARGGTAVVGGSATAADVAAVVDEHSVTRLVVVPTVVHDLLDLEPVPDLSSVRTVLVGGAGISDVLRDRVAQRLGIQIISSYGLTESPTGVARRRPGSAGASVLPGVEIEIVGPDGDVVDGGEGEVCLRPVASGPWAHTWSGMLGYWRDDAATRAAWRDGRLHTGDVGRIDQHGLTVIGRAGDAINRGGVTVHPATIERAAMAVAGVDDVAVVGLDDERLGQRIATVFVGDADPDDVRDHVRSELGGGRTPDVIESVAAVPRNVGGKPDNAAILALLG